MALEVASIKDELHTVPNCIDGLYLFPYRWFKYGLEHGHLEIEDLSFYDSLQGSIYLAAEEAKAYEHVKNRNGYSYDVWFTYEPGSGVVEPVFGPSMDKGVREINSKYLDHPVIFCNLDDLSKLPRNDQKTINNSIIQLLKGCRIKLKHSVWF